MCHVPQAWVTFHMDDSCRTYRGSSYRRLVTTHVLWVRIPHMHESRPIWMSHVVWLSRVPYASVSRVLSVRAHIVYAWVTSYVNESRPIWMSHVTHMNESCPICISLSCALSACPYRIWMSHVSYAWVTSHMNESCHAYEWVMSHIWMRKLHIWMSQEWKGEEQHDGRVSVMHEWDMNESCHMHDWVNESCHIYHLVNESCHVHDWVNESCYIHNNTTVECESRVKAHTWMSHITHMIESWHTQGWVMSHI